MRELTDLEVHNYITGRAAPYLGFEWSDEAKDAAYQEMDYEWRSETLDAAFRVDALRILKWAGEVLEALDQAERKS